MPSSDHGNSKMLNLPNWLINLEDSGYLFKNCLVCLSPAATLCELSVFLAEPNMTTCNLQGPVPSR